MFKIFKRKKAGSFSAQQINFKVCSHCHNRGSRYDISCSSCGEKFNDTLYCECGATRPANSQFCPFCGMDDFGKRKRKTEESSSQQTWQRKTEDFATVFTQKELMKKGYDQFVINAGTTGLLYQRGRFVGTLNPGPHKFKGLGDRFSQFKDKDAFQLILMDVGDMVMAFPITEIAHGDDSLSIDKKNLDLKLIFRLDNPDLFHLNVIKDRKHLEMNWLRARIEKTIDQRTREFIRQHPQSLDDMNFSQKLQMFLLDYLEDTLERFGVKLVDCETSFSSFSTALDQQRQDVLFELKGRYVELANSQSLWEMERRERAAARAEDGHRFDEKMEAGEVEHQQQLRETRQGLDQFREMEDLLLSGKRSDLILTEKEMNIYYETGLLELKKSDKEMLLKEQQLLREQKAWQVEFEQKRRELEQKVQEQDLELKDLSQEARVSEEKLSLLDRLLVSQNREKMMKLQSDEDWARYKREVDHKNILEEKEWAELQKAASRKSQDDESAWQHLQQVLELQRDNELRMTRIHQEREARKAELELETDEIKHRLKLKDLDGQQVEDAHQREIRMRQAEHLSQIDLKRKEMELELLRREEELKLKKVADMGDLDEQRQRLDMTLAMEERKHQMKLQEKTLDHEQTLQKAQTLGNVSIEAMLATITDAGIRESIIKTMKTRYEGENLNNLNKDKLMMEIENLKKDLSHQAELNSRDKAHFQELQNAKDQMQGEHKASLRDHIEDLKEEHGKERRGTYALTDSVMKGAAGVASGSKASNSGPEKVSCSFCGKQTVLFPGDTKCSHCCASIR
ncbi:MAG: hypothetical protein CSA81_09670 [Acidobacteria bacterium]|nr:MAG: hypothetical protein CSA81_09670 [Acidobacteriota bacterium]